MAGVVNDILLFVTIDVTLLYKIYCSSLPDSFILNVSTWFGCESKGQGTRPLPLLGLNLKRGDL